MGLAAIEPHSQIGLVLTEIQAFKNVKNLQRNVWKTGQFRTRFCESRYALSD